jgi:lactobin A/cerein 7B family class IIb bacteriocin
MTQRRILQSCDADGSDLRVLDVAELEGVEGGFLPVLVGVAVAAVIMTYSVRAI